MLKPAPHVFFKLIDGELVAWDCSGHRQFALTTSDLQRFLELAAGAATGDDPRDQDLIAAGLLIEGEPKVMHWGWDLLSQLYHIGTRDLPADHPIGDRDAFTRAYIDQSIAAAQMRPDMVVERSGPKTALPPIREDSFHGANLVDVLMSRKTCREFDFQSIDLQAVSDILRLTFGFMHATVEDLEVAGYEIYNGRKTSPSAGNCHGSEAYLIALRVDGLNRGIYHYSARQHVLTHVAEAPGDVDLTHILFGQYFVEGASFCVVVTSDFARYWWKYRHSRGYRAALLDVGHLSQTFQLLATAKGMKTWLTGAFMDSELERLLHLESPSESALFLLAAGTGSGSAVPKEFTLSTSDTDRQHYGK